MGDLSDGDVRLVKAITRLKLPCAVILGNHDRGKDRSGERLRQQISFGDGFLLKMRNWPHAIAGLELALRSGGGFLCLGLNNVLVRL